MPPILITHVQARRFMLQRLGLEQPHPDLATALESMGFVQMDPINVCGRMHDLILRNRVAGYREGDLVRHVHPGNGTRRTAFEHYVPGRGILVVFPMSCWPLIDAVTRARRSGRSAAWPRRPLDRAEERLADRILAELRERGPLTSDDFAYAGRAMTAWGTPGRLVKHVLEAMFHRGDVLIAGRRHFRRVYDLPERVIPDAARAAPHPDSAEILRQLGLLALRQRRLVRLPRVMRESVADAVVDVRLDSGGLLQVLREDAEILERAIPARDADEPHWTEPRLLAPLDPLIYDRGVTRRVWDFDYTWEVYTPPAKRVRGYYALPVLSRGAIVGHVEPRVDREARRLMVVSRRVRRGHATRRAVSELAHFLGVRAG